MHLGVCHHPIFCPKLRVHRELGHVPLFLDGERHVRVDAQMSEGLWLSPFFTFFPCQREHMWESFRFQQPVLKLFLRNPLGTTALASCIVLPNFSLKFVINPSQSESIIVTRCPYTLLAASAFLLHLSMNLAFCLRLVRMRVFKFVEKAVSLREFLVVRVERHE